MKKKTTHYLSRIKKTVQPAVQKVSTLTKAHPFFSLGIGLAVLLGIIALNTYLMTPEKDTPTEVTPEVVSVFTVGEAPRISVSAKVVESNVITVVAQSGGVVSRVPVQAGQEVRAYQQLAALSSTYYGSNAASIQRQMAELQYNNVVETYDTQKEVLSNSRELATLQAENADEQRKLTEASIGETKDLLELNEAMLEGIDASLASATDSAQIAELTGQKAQLLAGINQIKSGLRQAEYYGNDDSAVNKLANLSKDSTLKQLEMQEKALEMSKEISELQLKLARVQEATMYPATPCAGTVERVFVTPGQMVAPGTPIATIRANTGSTQLIAMVSQDIAARVSLAEPTHVTINNETVEIYPLHVSTVPTDGTLYSVTYALPVEYQNALAHNTHVAISVPVGSADTSAVIPFLPLESVHQSEKESSIYVVRDGTVHSQTVTVGTVQGRFVEITSGLEEGTQVILERDLIEGQAVEIQ